MATLEFIALECIRPSELAGDEVYIQYSGATVYPEPGAYHPFRKGDRMVNQTAELTALELAQLMMKANAFAPRPCSTLKSFLRCKVPAQGLVVHIMDKDLFARDDRIGEMLVLPIGTNGVQSRVLSGGGGQYRFTWRVMA